MLSDEQLADRIQAHLHGELAELVAPPDLVSGMWDAARHSAGTTDETRRADSGRRPTRFTFANVATAAVPVLTAVIALIAVIALRHHTPPPRRPRPPMRSHTPRRPRRLPIGAQAGPLHVPANTFQGAAIPSTLGSSQRHPTRAADFVGVA